MEGASILTRPPHRIAEIGIGRTFQNVALFPNLSVLDNVRVGTHARTSSDIISDSLRLAWVRRSEADVNKKVHEILGYLDLEDVAHTVGVRPALRHAEARRARARARGRSEDPAARRARRRPQPRGSPRARRPHPPHPRRPQDHRAAGRASHGPRDVDRRPRRRAEFRQASSPKARRPRCRPTPTSSRPIWGARTNDDAAQRQGPARLLRPGPGAARPDLLAQRGHR